MVYCVTMLHADHEYLHVHVVHLDSVCVCLCVCLFVIATSLRQSASGVAEFTAQSEMRISVYSMKGHDMHMHVAMNKLIDSKVYVT